MRSRLVVPVLLAVSLVAAVAFAASDRVEVSFDQFQASGVTGTAALNPMRPGETQIHAKLEGLQPGVSYVSRLYLGDQACGTVGEQIVIFTANPAGKAQWNQRVPQDITAIGSISVQLESDNSLQACAGVTQ